MPPIRQAKTDSAAFQQKLESFYFMSVSTRTRSANRGPASTPTSPPEPLLPAKPKPKPNLNANPKTITKQRRGKRKTPSTYAPPEKYAHLGGVQDAFAPDLLSVFIGLNPGIATATVGHAYSAPSNHFWKLLHSSGLTPDRVCPSTEDVHLPRKYSLGNTNLVARATLNQAELSTAEMDGGVAVAEAKIRRWRPESVCVVGKGIWESVYRAWHGGARMPKDAFVWGWQADDDRFGRDLESGYEGARVFVVPSTSGLVAGYSMQFKKDLWKVLGDWVQMRRKERGETAPRTDNLEQGTGEVTE